MRLEDIVFDCQNAARRARFWAAAPDDDETRPHDQED
jgi:hypothetical protein